MKSSIIVSHYKEDLTWLESLDKLKFDINVYSKTDKKYNYIEKNLGNEATSYLKYIIENYDNLYDHNFFVHGHNKSDHQDISHVEFFEYVAIPPKYNFFNISRRDHYNENFGLGSRTRDQFNRLEKHWPFKKDVSIDVTLSSYGYAEFYVHKELILGRAKDFYIEMYDWLMTTDIDVFWSSRYFEYTWHKIFTKQNVEPRLEYSDLLQ